MPSKLITAPTAEPITLAEAKLHLRVDSTDEDALITALIVAARQGAEQMTGRALMPQTWEIALDGFPDEIELQHPPLASITSVSYLDEASAAQTLSAAAYVIDSYSQPERLSLVADTEWPATLEQANAVIVRFVAGYASAAAIPQEIKQWMLLRIGLLYEHRESVAGSLAPLPFADRLLDAYRVGGL
ncbi:head-tail connector protein [Methylibium sp.]|uniref:head-tail connector protein n=1 Tax=Methylibium sp. TaxID=2067992 RepID=UPI0018215280|nr:head-tail connector protein [Methylibium sp.]MBA3588298.1 phage head-tail connector protein [Methylibium sp.]